MTGMTYRGEPADFVIRHALAFSGEVMLELVQPIGGPSIWQEYLDARGPSLHHIAFYVDDFEAAAAEMASRGWVAVQAGAGSGGRATACSRTTSTRLRPGSSSRS